MTDDLRVFTFGHPVEDEIVNLLAGALGMGDRNQIEKLMEDLSHKHEF